LKLGMPRAAAVHSDDCTKSRRFIENSPLR
jgi:hypothetical protein